MDLIKVEVSKRNYHRINHMINWLNERWGQGDYLTAEIIPNDRRWAWRHAFGDTTFFFKNDRDATWFRINWHE